MNIEFFEAVIHKKSLALYIKAAIHMTSSKCSVYSWLVDKSENLNEKLVRVMMFMKAAMKVLFCNLSLTLNKHACVIAV